MQCISSIFPSWRRVQPRSLLPFSSCLVQGLHEQPIASQRIQTTWGRIQPSSSQQSTIPHRRQGGYDACPRSCVRRQVGRKWIHQAVGIWGQESTLSRNYPQLWSTFHENSVREPSSSEKGPPHHIQTVSSNTSQAVDRGDQEGPRAQLECHGVALDNISS